MASSDNKLKAAMLWLTSRSLGFWVVVVIVAVLVLAALANLSIHPGNGS